MILTNKQAMVLFQILKDTLDVPDASTIFTWPKKERLHFYTVIINQQSDKLIDLEKVTKDD